MAAIDWPATLPQRPLADGYSEQGPTDMLASPVERGPDKRRRAGAPSPGRISFTLALTPAQADALDTFFEVTTRYGVFRFNWPHPRKGTIEVAFAQRPRITDRNRVRFNAAIVLDWYAS